MTKPKLKLVAPCQNRAKANGSLIYGFLRCPKFGMDRRIINCMACFKSNQDCIRGKEITEEFKQEEG